MLFLCLRMPFVCHSYVIRMSNVCTGSMWPICHIDVTRMYSYVICMLLVYARILSVGTSMSSVCHSYAFVFHLYVTRMYLYVNCMSLVCTRMSSICHSYITRMSSVCHLYVLVCHLYVTRMHSYVIRMSLVCTRMSSKCHSYVVLPWTFITCKCCLLIDTILFRFRWNYQTIFNW